MVLIGNNHLYEILCKIYFNFLFISNFHEYLFVHIMSLFVKIVLC